MGEETIPLSKPPVPAVGNFPDYGGNKGSRVDFDPEQFEEAIKTKGLEYYWSRAGYCPCEANDQTGMPDPNCSICTGDGFYYYHPEQETNPNAAEKFMPIPGIFSSIQMDPSIHERWGEYWHGTATLTTRGMHRLSFMDRLWSPYQIFPLSQVLERQAGVDTVTVGSPPYGTKYGIRRVLSIRDTSTVFRLNTDYTLTEGLYGDRTLTWLNGKGPAEGARFAISYEGTAVWRVVSHQYAVQQSVRKSKNTSQQSIWLPVTALLRLEWLIVNSVG